MIPCLSIEAKKGNVYYSSGKVLLNVYLSVPFMDITCVATPCLTIPHVALSKLHDTCTFHTMRKGGPRKHIKDNYAL